MSAGPDGLRPADVAVGGGFLLTGMASVLLGPLLPELRASWGVTPAQASSLFVAQFGASSIGAVVSSLHLRRSLVAGYALIAAGLAGVAGGGWATARPAIAVTGFGLGLVIAGSNLWTAHRRPERRGARLATLNLLWGLGAVACPLLVAAGRGRIRMEVSLGALAAAAALISAAVALTLRAEGRLGSRRPAPAAGGIGAPWSVLALLAGMFFLYVGTENAVGGWLVTLADEHAGRRTVASLLIGSGFWGAVLVGRAVTPRLLRRLDESGLYRICLALAAAGTLLLVLSESTTAVAAGGLAAGLGMAPLFPLTVSKLAARTAETRSRGVGWVLACGGVGGAVLPWLTGRMSGPLGFERSGFLVPLGALAVLAALHRATDAVRQRTAEEGV